MSVIYAQHLKVSWGPTQADNISNYKIYRSVDDQSNFELIQTIDHPDTIFIDSNFEYNSRYFYAAKSVDQNGVESEYSNIAEIVTPNIYSLTITANPTEGGTISQNPQKSDYIENEQVTLTATAEAGFQFSHWSGDVSSTESSVVIKMDGDKNVTANFVAEQYVLNVSVDSTGWGTVSLTPDKQYYNFGEEVSLKAQPNSDYRFDHWSGDVTGTNKSFSLIMDADKNVTAHFVRKFHISGNVKHGSSGLALASTEMGISGDSSGFQLADKNGFYEFASLEPGADYLISAQRSSGNDENCIISYDAFLAARIALNLNPNPTQIERIAADVDNNGAVQMFDAALIVQFAVGLHNSESQAGSWGFSPSERTYSFLDSSKLNQDFDATMVGDVDGNWTPDSPLAKSNAAKKSYDYLSDIEAEIGEQVVIPLIAAGEREVNSFDLTLNYDNRCLQFIQVNKTDMVQNFQIFTNNSEDGTLRVGGFGVEPLTESGTYLELVFEAIGNKGDASQVEFISYRINAEEEQYAIATVVIASGSLTQAPEDFVLHNNYPNPFNPHTQIKFELPQPGYVSLKIYNMLGQEIKTLVNQTMDAGYHQVAWNGQNASGHVMPSGFYIYRLQADNFVDSKKMFLMK